MIARCICAWLLLGGLPPTGGSSPEPEPEHVRAAAGRALALVEKAARSYPGNRSCFSCHHQTLPMLAMVAARDRGLAIDEALLRGQAEFSHASFQGRIAGLKAGKNIGGASMTVGYGLWALDLAGQPADETTAAMASFLIQNQKPDGRWERTSSRPPLEDSNVTCTALAAYYLQRFAGVAERPRVEAAVEKAKAWLRSADGKSQEDENFKLWGLQLLGAGEDEIAAARERVLARQKPDGGWSQLPEMESDAYATGQTLAILLAAGLPASHPACRKGIRFLLATQLEDGSWFVKSRSKPIQSLFDNGDPHGLDQFISTPATAWAAAALAASLPPRRWRF